jgi:phosphate transport system permease protein
METVVKGVLVASAIISIATTVGIVFSFVGPTIEFFERITFREFFTGTRWAPTLTPETYGVLPLLSATIITTLIAVAIAIPLGLGAAIYLAEYASERARRIYKPILEVLAGIPTVVYGVFAIFALNPVLQRWWPTENGPDFRNLLAAGIVMGVMIVPTVASVSEDAMSAVPRSLREGAYALASSPMQVATRVVVPAAISGIMASFVLGISRALGETMIVTIAGGLTSDHVVLDPRQGAATMTAFIANIAGGDIPIDSFDYRTIFVVGALLFTFTFVLNAISIRMVRRFREVYE